MGALLGRQDRPREIREASHEERRCSFENVMLRLEPGDAPAVGRANHFAEAHERMHLVDVALHRFFQRERAGEICVESVAQQIRFAPQAPQEPIQERRFVQVLVERHDLWSAGCRSTDNRRCRSWSAGSSAARCSGRPAHSCGRCPCPRSSPCRGRRAIVSCWIRWKRRTRRIWRRLPAPPAYSVNPYRTESTGTAPATRSAYFLRAPECLSGARHLVVVERAIPIRL